MDMNGHVGIMALRYDIPIDNHRLLMYKKFTIIVQ